MTDSIERHITSLTADCAALAETLRVNQIVFAARHGDALRAALMRSGDRPATRFGQDLTAAFLAGIDWDEEIRGKLRRISQALFRLAKHRGPMADRAPGLRDRLHALQSQELRLRTLRDVLAILRRRAGRSKKAGRQPRSH